MTPMVEGAGVPLSYEEHGEGPAVLLVHGIGGRAAASWPSFTASARMIAYDRRGYGESGAPEPYARTTVEEQAEDAAALVRALDAEPVVAVGEGLGGLVALDLARRHRPLIRGVVAIDPPLLAFVPEASEVLAAEREALENDVRESGPQEAVRRHLVDAGVPGPAAERAAVDFRAFFADYAAASTWPVGRRELRTLSVPLAVLDGPDPPRHVRIASDAVAGLVPGAERSGQGALVEMVATLAGA
jgi:pimeloyl-ACP methyl ester carboxylesterase